jgi:tyrosine-protein kinase Etk/Wzc
MSSTTEKSFENVDIKINKKSNVLDYRLILATVLSKWYILLISLILTFAVTYIYIKKANRVYEGFTTILLKDPKAKNVLDAQTLIGYNVARTQSPIENEQVILQSATMTYNALKRIPWQVSYYAKGRLRTNNSYISGPYIVLIDTTKNQVAESEFSIEFTGSDKFILKSIRNAGYLYKYSTNKYIKRNDEFVIMPNIEYNREHKFGDTISTPNFTICIIKGPDDVELYKYSKLSFKLNQLSKLVNTYQQGITVEPTSKTSSVLKVTFRFYQPEILQDFLNALTAEYIESGLANKNEVAYRTISFIDNELLEIRTQLTNAESDLETYRKDNKLLDLNEEAQRIFDHMKELDNEKARLQLKNKYYNYLKDYLESHQDPAFIIVPSAMGIEDPVTGDLLAQLAKLYSESSSLSLSATKRNPALKKIEAEIEQARKNILENTKNNIKLSKISLDDNTSRSNTVSTRIYNLPTNQRKLLDFQREFNLYNQLYVFLLQKKAEAQITAATNMADNQVLDPCRTENIVKIAPKAGFYIINAFIIAVLLSFAIIFLPSFLKNTFTFTREIEEASPFPIAGYIMHNEDKNEKVFTSTSFSPVGESFRTLRTNMNFFVGNKTSFVMQLTSDVPQCGKTFISVNLGYSFAISGRKTVIIGADMRKSRIHKIMGMSSKPGLSDYLASKVSLNEIIFPTDNSNLFIIPSGTTPPNPSELLESERTNTVFSSLREQFNIIIIDSPPAISVTDANILMPKCDMTAFVIRIKKTKKNIIKDLFTRIRLKNIPQPVVIVNDIPARNTYGYGYGYGYAYGYGYGYGYGYHSDEHKKSKIKSSRLRRVFKA